MSTTPATPVIVSEERLMFCVEAFAHYCAIRGFSTNDLPKMGKEYSEFIADLLVVAVATGMPHDEIVVGLNKFFGLPERSQS